MQKIIGSALFAVVALLWAQAAMAQGANCAPHADAINFLATNFGETRQSIGIVNDGSVLEIYANTESGSWTAVMTQPSGISCFVAGGEAFEVTKEELPISGEPT